MKSIKEGILKGIGVMMVFGTAVFAVQVTGTIKTWTTGDTLTAADLNTTVQSLKTAVEGATQLVEFGYTSPKMIETAYGTLVSGITLSSPASTTMSRSGTVKNAKIIIASTMPLGCVLTLTKNGVDTAISMAAPNGAGPSTISDSDTVSFTTGETLGWKHFCSGGSGTSLSLYPMVVSFEF